MVAVEPEAADVPEAADAVEFTDAVPNARPLALALAMFEWLTDVVDTINSPGGSRCTHRQRHCSRTWPPPIWSRGGGVDSGGGGGLGADSRLAHS